MFSNMYLHWNSKCAQVLAKDFEWVDVYPIKTKDEAHKASMATLSQIINVMAIQLGAKTCEDEDVKPATGTCTIKDSCQS